MSEDIKLPEARMYSDISVSFSGAVLIELPLARCSTDHGEV